MSAEGVVLPPPVMWAQTSNTLFLTYNVECKDPEIRFEEQSVYFKGVGLPENKTYEVLLELYSKIIPEKCVKHNTGRSIEVVITKLNKGEPFWPCLNKDKKKLHFLKFDFSKIQDENDSGDESCGQKNTQNLEEMMRSMGGLKENDEKPSFDVASDSDDDDLPDLE